MKTNLKMNFIEYQYELVYYNLIDLITQLGGISATISLATGSIAFIFTI